MTHRLSRNIRYHIITFPVVAIWMTLRMPFVDGNGFVLYDLRFIILFPWLTFVFYLFVESFSKSIFFDDYNFYIHSPFREKHLESHHLKTVTDVMSWFFVIVVKFKDGDVERKVFCFPGGPQSFKELLNPRGFFEDDRREELFNEHVARVKGKSS